MLKPGTDYVFTKEGTLVMMSCFGQRSRRHSILNLCIQSSEIIAIGGFHTLCADVGKIPGHPFSGYKAGDPLPTSLWNGRHRPKCENPGGMVYDRARDLWVDIYLCSNPDRSIRHETLDDYEKIGTENGKRLPTHDEFSSLGEGSNELTNIQNSKYAPITGGHVDTLSRRMISDIGCEDCAGLVWQWLLSSDPADPEYRLVAGGHWDNAATCGSRYRNANNYRWYAFSVFGARFVSEPLYPRERRTSQENGKR